MNPALMATSGVLRRAGCGSSESFTWTGAERDIQRSANVAQFLLEGKNAQDPALMLLDRDYTYGELQAAAVLVGSFLIQAGGLRGDRVILVSENSFFWVVSYLGILQAGMVCVPLPADLSPHDLQYILQITEPRFAFLQAKVASNYGSRFQNISVVTDPRVVDLPATTSLRSFSELQVQRDETVFPPVCPDDLAALMFTSGSTGRPRGVMISHANIIANTESIIHCLELTQENRIMTVLPFHYCFGTSLLHTHLRVGGSLVIDHRFMYPEKILQRIQETECTGFAGVPSHYQVLLRRSSLRKMSFPHLRNLQQAGGHLAPAFIRELRNALAGTRIFVMYGQTEATARLSWLPPELLDKKLGSIGKGIPGVKLQVLNEHGEEVNPGEVGEIVAEGDNVALGYWRNPQESAVSFRMGKLHTGDLATVDEDGFIYVVDRAKDFVKCGGRRVGCRELEEQLLDFDDLLEAAVIGVPDDVLGEAIKAFVVPRDRGSTALEERLRQFCKERIPLRLNPKSIVVLDALPRNSAGKVLKSSLRML